MKRDGKAGILAACVCAGKTINKTWMNTFHSGKPAASSFLSHVFPKVKRLLAGGSCLAVRSQGAAGPPGRVPAQSRQGPVGQGCHRWDACVPSKSLT